MDTILAVCRDASSSKLDTIVLYSLPHRKNNKHSLDLLSDAWWNKSQTAVVSLNPLVPQNCVFLFHESPLSATATLLIEII